jgi:hypothetical protein
VIDVSVRDENGIDIRMLPRPFGNKICLGNRLQFQGCPEETLTGEIGIDENNGVARFEKITVRPEIRDSDSVGWSGGSGNRVRFDQLRVFLESAEGRHNGD